VGPAVAVRTVLPAAGGGGGDLGGLSALPMPSSPLAAWRPRWGAGRAVLLLPDRQQRGGVYRGGARCLFRGLQRSRREEAGRV